MLYNIICCYNLIRETDKTRKPTQQHSSTDLDTETDMETPGGLEGDRTIPRAQDALYRLEIESHRIEQATRNLQNNPSQHHVTQGMGRKILQALTPRGFSLDIRTPEVQELRWSHLISGTCFDTLPDLEEVTIILSYWHCLKATWHSQAGTILVPSSGNDEKLEDALEMLDSEWSKDDDTKTQCNRLHTSPLASNKNGPARIKRRMHNRRTEDRQSHIRDVVEDPN